MTNAQLAYLGLGPLGADRKAGMLLQNYHTGEFTENLQVHLLVRDIDAWSKNVQDHQSFEEYGIRVNPPENREWKMRDFILLDFAGVARQIREP